MWTREKATSWIQEHQLQMMISSISLWVGRVKTFELNKDFRLRKVTCICF